MIDETIIENVDNSVIEDFPSDKAVTDEVLTEQLPITYEMVTTPEVPRYFHTTPIAEYTVSEGYLFLISMILLLGVAIKLFNR